MATPAKTESAIFDPRAYLAIAIFRWKTIALCILLCMLAAVGYLLFAPAQFLTESVVVIYRDPTLVVSDAGTQWSSIQMHTWLLTSDDLQATVIQKLQPKWQQEVGGFSRMKKTPFRVDMARGQGSMLILSIRNSKPAYAIAYIEAVWDEFMARQQARKTQLSGDVSLVLDSELKSLEGDIRQAEDELIDFTRLVAYDVVAASNDMERRYLLTLLGYKNALTTQLMLLETEFPMLQDGESVVVANVEAMTHDVGNLRPGREAAHAAARKDDAGTDSGKPAEVTESSAVPSEFATTEHLLDTPEIRNWSSMKVELARLQTLTNGLLAKFTPDHPEVKAVTTKIGYLQEQLKIAFEVAYGRLKDRRKAIKILLAAIDVPIREWNNNYRRASVNESEFKRKGMVVERREALYRTLYSRLQDLKVAQELKADHFLVLAKAKTDEEPVWPVPSKVIMLAVALALGLGFGLATLQQMFDNKMQTVLDVEQVMGVPFIGGVPKWSGGSHDKVARPIVLEEHASGAIEAYRVLRTNILSALEKSGHKIVLFTSAEAGEGKTITALNLAAMMAQVGKRILLVDMDLRRPRLHKSLRCERSPGVTEALAGGGPLESFAVPTEVENLWFIPAGEARTNVPELLQAVNLTTFFAAAREQYDYILIDTSPVLRAADVSILSVRELCAVVFVARVNSTPKPIIKYALEQLVHAQILGIIMNCIDLNRISSLYYSYQYPNYAYYSYSYAYGYNYDQDADDGKNKRGRKGRGLARLHSIVKGLRHALLPNP